jgi:hypothetical protein
VENAFFGSSVASAGDVDSDGYADVVIGAQQFDNGGTMPGFVSVFLGSPSGLEATAAWLQVGPQNGADFGYSVSSAGDVDGDGALDLIIGGIRYDNPTNMEGAAWVFLGAHAEGGDTGGDDDGKGDDGTGDDGTGDDGTGDDGGDDSGASNGDVGAGGDDGDEVSDSSGNDEPGCGCGSTRRSSAYLLVALAALVTRRRNVPA